MSKAVLLRTDNVIEFHNFTKDSLDFYYKTIGCDLIDIVQAYELKRLGYKDFILIVDDEGLLKENFKINIYASLLYGQPLAGNILVCKEEFRDDGIHTIGLEQKDIDDLFEGLTILFDKRK